MEENKDEEEDEENFVNEEGILFENVIGMDTHTPGACRCIVSCNEKRRRARGATLP